MIECREKNIRRAGNRHDTASEWRPWEPCAGTEDLTPAENARLVKDWEKRDREDTPWLRIKYRTAT